MDMIDLGFAMLPFWDPQEEIGGYKLGLFHDLESGQDDVVGPTNKNHWMSSAKNHNLIFQRDLLVWLEEQTGPGSSPESRRVLCWDCTALCSMILQPMLLTGYKQTESWTPKKQEFFILDDGKKIHTMVFRSRKTGVEIRIISLKAFVRGSNGLPAVMRRCMPDRLPLGDIPIEKWGLPQDGGLRAIQEHTLALCDLWTRCYYSGYIYESSGRTISAGGIAWANFCRELYKIGKVKPWQIMYPGLSPEQVIVARDIMEFELRPGMRG